MDRPRGATNKGGSTVLARRLVLMLVTGLALNATAGEVVHVTVKNNGSIPHNLEFELESAKIEKTLFDTNLQPGETRTADFTFTQSGKWEMYCPVDQHRQRG